jgi:hypothetical protein
MLTLIAAAALAAQATPAQLPANTQAGHAQHQMGQAGEHKDMDCCKDCCKDMASKEHGERAGHDTGHAEDTAGN